MGTLQISPVFTGASEDIPLAKLLTQRAQRTAAEDAEEPLTAKGEERPLMPKRGLDRPRVLCALCDSLGELCD